MQAFSNLHVDNTPYPGCMLTSIYCVTINYILSLDHLLVASHISVKRWPNDKVKGHCETKNSLCYRALLSFKAFRWHPLNLRLQLPCYLVSYQLQVMQLPLYSTYIATVANSWPELDIKVFIACSYIASYVQITAAFDWPHLFCTLGVLFSMQILQLHS